VNDPTSKLVVRNTSVNWYSAGQLITEGRIAGTETTLQVSTWQKGVYFFKLQPLNGKTIVKRFVKL
jgi:hypothetical protein